MTPALEARPVVTSYQEDELPVGIVTLKMLQGIPGIGRLGQLELVTGGLHPSDTFQSLLRHLKAQLVVQEVGLLF